MLDEDTVRDRLARLRERLNNLDAERVAITEIIKGYEKLLSTVAPVELKHANRGFRAAIKQVLKDALGEPLHAKEIWQRISVMGITTNSKEPISAVDYALYTIHEAKKVGPRIWKWDDSIATAQSVSAR